MRILYLRHGATSGNRESRYIGRTDEPLSSEGIAQLQGLDLEPSELLICSPMRRCIQTAEIVFPGQKPYIVPELRECDFGDFEGKNYIEMNGDPAYQAWVDSGGTAPFPNGESPADFRRRCTDAFSSLLRAFPDVESMALVVHGGTIMAILSDLLGGDFYGYGLPNGGVYVMRYENGKAELL